MMMILRAYRTLGIDPYFRIKCNKCSLLGDGYHLYLVLEHMNDHHRASFREIGSYLETLGQSKLVYLKPSEYDKI